MVDVALTRFFRDDGIIVVIPGSTSVTTRELAARCGLGCVLTLRRLPGALALCYEVDAGLGTRVDAKLVGEFFEALGRVVVGAEVVAKERFTKPEGMVGPYVIVAAEGAEIDPSGAAFDADLVAVDLSASEIKTLPERCFQKCYQLSAIAFPPKLRSIGNACFYRCDALRLVDLSTTELKALGDHVFFACGATRVSVPASLREIGYRCFVAVPLKVIDLGACAGVTVRSNVECEATELRLPREGFADAAEAFLPGSFVSALEADIDEGEMTRLQAQLDEWGIDNLRIVSSRLPPCEWRRDPPLAVPVHLTDPMALSTTASVTMRTWRTITADEMQFVQSIDLSGLAIDSLPAGAALEGMVWLERAVLPAWLRVLLECFFLGCSRLALVDVSGCTVLERIEDGACGVCKSLAAFEVPRTVRVLENAFAGTSITVIDLTETDAESLEVIGVLHLQGLLLPRRCALQHAFALPSLRRATFGVSSDCFGCHPTEVRFESMTASSVLSPGLAGARVYAEVACELGRETIPSLPP
jgi:hypothetical protein